MSDDVELGEILGDDHVEGRCRECGTRMGDDVVNAPSPLRGQYCPACAEFLAAELLSRAGEVAAARRAEQLAELEDSHASAGDDGDW